MLLFFEAECTFGWLGARDHHASHAITAAGLLVDGRRGDGVVRQQTVAHHMAGAWAQLELEMIAGPAAVDGIYLLALV